MTAEHRSDRSGRYTAAAKVAEDFGDDTMAPVAANVG